MAGISIPYDSRHRSHFARHFNLVHHLTAYDSTLHESLLDREDADANDLFSTLTVQMTYLTTSIHLLTRLYQELPTQPHGAREA